MDKVIALDIGGTNTRVALINSNYEIEAVKINPTVVGNLDNFLSSVVSIIKEAIPDLSEVKAIAIGVPGRVRYDGYIDALPNIGIANIPLSSYLEEVFHLPVYVKNDAEVAALAEANVGPYAKAKSLYFVTISTGVGGAMTLGGRLVASSYEVGHTLTPYKGELYEFEHLASGTGLVLLAKLNGIELNSAKEFFDGVIAKDEAILAVYRDWISLLAGWIKMNQENFNPEIFALTGGVMKSKAIFWEDLKKACPFAHLEECASGQYAGLVGASVFGFQNAK